MRKRILSLLLVLIMCVSLFPAQVLATDEAPEVCATEGCAYEAGHEGNCSNYVAPSADELAAQAVIELIAAIGTVTRQSEAAIAAAHNAYAALSDEQKALVTNLDILEAAKLAYGALDTPTVTASSHTPIYDNSQGNNTRWPSESAYVKKITIDKTLNVKSYTWSGDVCAITLDANTSLTADVKIRLTLTNGVTLVAAGKTFDTTAANFTIKLSAGQASVDAVFSGGGVSVTKTFIFVVDGVNTNNTKPALKEGVESSASAVAYTGVPFTVNLKDIFTDADGDALTYTVKIGNDAAKAAEENFSHTFTEASIKEQKLVFTANDGMEDSPSYTVKVTHVIESSITLDKDEALVDLGSTLTLIPSVTPETAELIWTSSNEAVATVANGVVTPIAEGEAVITASAAGKSATCTVIVNDPSILRARVNMTINNQGTLALIKEPVTVSDLDRDGALTYHEALVAAHTAYGKTYVAEESSYGLFVTTLWDVYTGGSNYFFLNDSLIPSSVGVDTVQNGDDLYTTNLVDIYGWSDAYSRFNTSSAAVTVGEEFTLTLSGGSVDIGTLGVNFAPLSGIAIGTYSESYEGSFTALDKTTDANGQITLSFDNPGTYIVSASGKTTDAYGMEYAIMPPVCIVSVKAAQPESVTLSHSELTMTINSTHTLTASVLPSNAANKSLIWTSSNEAVATIDSNGKISAKTVGETIITACTINGKTATCLLTVELADPAADAEVTMTISKRGVLELLEAPITVKDLNSDGFLTFDEALSAVHEEYFEGENGFAVNTESGWVYKMWGIETSNLLFYKNDLPLSKFVCDTSSSVSAGDSLYAAILMYEEAYKDWYTTFDRKTVNAETGEEISLALSGFIGAHASSNLTWERVSGASIGLWEDGQFKAIEGKTTDENGQVTISFEKAGTYVVSAYRDDISGPLMAPYCTVTVKAAAVEESVSLDKSEVTMSVGDEQTITATVTPENAEIEWSSSDVTVATVENGKVTALKEGTATITAKVGSKEATCLVSVEAAAIEYLSVLKFKAGTTASAAEYKLQPAFDPGIKEYTLIVPDSKTTVAVWATLANGQSGAIQALYTNTSNQSKSVTVSSGKTTGASLTSVLKTALTGNTVTITVGSEEAYVINIVRQATLSGLTLTWGEDGAAELDPKFSGDTAEYNARVPHDCAITVTPKARISASTITINGDTNNDITPVWNGLNSAVEIVVSGGAANPSVVPSTYHVNLVQRASAIEIDTPPTKTEYEAGEKFSPDGMTLKATYSDGSSEIIEKSRFSYEPDGALALGASEIEVSFDGLTVKQPITMAAVFEGSGTQEDPFQIHTAEDYQKLYEMVAAGASFEGQYLKQMENITLNSGWKPIGSLKGSATSAGSGGINANSFSGNLDGGGKLLTIPAGGLPLLGYVKNASVKNLNIFGSQIAGYGLVNNLEGLDFVGNAITIENVTLKSGSSTLKAGLIGTYITTNGYGGCSLNCLVTIRNCTVESGVIIGYNRDQSMIGSFAGRGVNGTIENCVSYATVYGVDSVGGIVGSRDNTLGSMTIKNCSFGGSVVASGSHAGGIMGSAYVDTSNTGPNAVRANVLNCSVSGSISGADKVGGIIGGDSSTAQLWNTSEVKNNSFTGTVSASSGAYVGGIIGYYRSLNKFDDITNNYYSASCGANKGIGGVEYVDTNCATHETASGATYLNTETSTSGCPSITGCSWRKAHNRTDDPLGADAAKLCYTDTQTAPIAVELKLSGDYKSEYIEGEELDLSGIKLTVIFNDNSTQDVELKDATVSGYDKTKLGEQKITVSYEGLTAELAITVIADGKIAVSVTILGDSFHDSDSDGNVHTLAGGNLTTWVGKTELEFENSATAWDALQKVMDENGLSYSYEFNAFYGSIYIQAVNGLGQFTNGDNSGWQYTVNGVHPNVGVSLYYLSDGDNIVLHYTDDYTKESGGQGFDDRDEAAADEVEKLIDDIGTVSLDSKEKIEAARKAYDALSYTQKLKVENLKKLTDAEAKYAELKKADDKKKADAVEELIRKLNKNSPSFENDVKAAKNAYDKLSADQKKLVDNYGELVAALKLIADTESKEAAAKVEKLIRDIGTVTEDSEEKIAAARKAYDELTEEQKALVENLAELENAEAKLEYLKALASLKEKYMSTGDYIEALGNPGIGSIGGEWMVIGLARSDRGIEDEEAYYEAVTEYVAEEIDENSRLHKVKSTENSRMILALTAIGKDVTNVGGHNLLAGLDEMSYIRKQGINGPIWALIAFDSANYPTPEGDVSRDSLIEAILSEQNEDGGWSLSGDVSDADMTGMALQALAPYYQAESAPDNSKARKDVTEAVEKALEALSKMQDSDGGFSGIDGSSSESIAQVIVALSALGIDAHKDERFIKNGVSAIEALLAFRLEDGSFKHILEGKTDGMATEQAYYALCAYFRMLEEKTSLYDMTDILDMSAYLPQEAPAQSEPVTEEVSEEESENKPAEKIGFFRWLINLIFGKKK